METRNKSTEGTEAHLKMNDLLILTHLADCCTQKMILDLFKLLFVKSIIINRIQVYFS